MLQAAQVPCLAVDINAEQVIDAGLSQIMVGDPLRRDLLERAGIANAKAAVLTLDNPKVAEGLVHRIRRHWQLPIVARARDAHHALSLREAGADVVVQEIEAAGRQLGQALLTELGYTSDGSSAAAINRAD